MTLPTDVNVVIGGANRGIAQTLRMALRGVGVRTVFLAHDLSQLTEGLSTVEPHVLIVYVENGAESDMGMEMLRFVRRSSASANRQLPVVAVSQQRDMTTIQAVGNGGAHEYVLFPVAGDMLLKKVHAARTSTRPFIDTVAYVGPDRTPPAATPKSA